MLTKLALTGDLGCSKVNGNMRNLGCRMMDSRSRARMTLMSQAGKPGGTLGRGSAGRSASATHTVGWCGGSVGWTRLQSRYSVTGYKEVVIYIYTHGNAILYFMCRLRFYTQPTSQPSYILTRPDLKCSLPPRARDASARERASVEGEVRPASVSRKRAGARDVSRLHRRRIATAREASPHKRT